MNDRAGRSILGGPRRAPEPVAAAVRRFDSAIEGVAARVRGRRRLDRAVYALTEAGNHSLLWHAVNGVDACIGLVRHDSGRVARARRRIVLQALEQAAVNGPVKVAFRRERPGVVTAHPHSLRRPRTSSFPSGHASAAFCAARLLAADNGRGWLWFGLAAAIGWTRVHVGVHHPSDVVGGAVLGVGLASVAARVWPPPEPGTGNGVVHAG